MNDQKIFDNGVFIKVNGPSVAGWHKCKFQELLGNQDESYGGQLDNDLLKWIGAPLPKDKMADVLALVKQFPHTEVHVCLYYNMKERDWLFHVPKQKGSPAAVHYDDEDYTPPAGYYFTGTIHTHPNLGAFWSGTDKADQEKKTGLHVVLGLREGVLEDYLVCLAYNGARYEQNKSIVEMPDLDNLPEPRKDWLEMVKEDFNPVREVEAGEGCKTADYKYHPSYNWRDYYRDEEYSWLDKSSYNCDYYGPEYSWEKQQKDIKADPVNTDFLEDILTSMIYNFSEQQCYEAARKILNELGEISLAEKVGEAAYRSVTESDSEYGL